MNRINFSRFIDSSLIGISSTVCVSVEKECSGSGKAKRNFVLCAFGGKIEESNRFPFCVNWESASVGGRLNGVLQLSPVNLVLDYRKKRRKSVVISWKKVDHTKGKFRASGIG